MTIDPLVTACRVFSEAWLDFKFKKSQRAWVKKTSNEVMLLCHLQRSRWAPMFYLNFGVYFIGLEAVAKSSSRLPTPIDWHLYARYGNFQKLSTDEHNTLFSLEESDRNSLEVRCRKIAKFTVDIILKRLSVVSDFEAICREVSQKNAEAVFMPFNTQMIGKQDILEYISEKFAMDARVGGVGLRDTPATRVKRDTRS